MRLYLELPNGTSITAIPETLGMTTHKARQLVTAAGGVEENSGELLDLMTKLAADLFHRFPEGNC